MATTPAFTRLVERVMRDAKSYSYRIRLRLQHLRRKAPKRRRL